ncbi:MAG: YheU family protein [Pseudomonadota bacterium]
MIKIDSQLLSDDALLGVIDDFILREGTDYGEHERTLEAKRDQVRAQLDAGTAEIWFDPDSQTVTLRRADDPPPT